MLIVKPYGRSDTAPDKENALRRQLRLRPKDSDPHDLGNFAASHAELLVAQWISAIDRIARKPSGRDLPTPEQRGLRDKLGAAAWNLLAKRVPADSANELEKLWRRKVHPYGDKNDGTSQGRERGRWYTRFAGDLKPSEIGEAEAKAIARRIEKHLHEEEYRICGDRPNKRQGRIVARAESIAGNFAEPVRELPQTGWTESDLARYRKAGDIAAVIKKAAAELEAKNRRVGAAVAAKALHAHYAELFADETGEPLSIAGAKAQEPGPVCPPPGGARNLQASSSRTTARTGRSTARDGGRSLPSCPQTWTPCSASRMPWAATGISPRWSDSASWSTTRPRRLRKIRLRPGTDPAHAIDRWPGDGEIDGSRYRTSAGQSEIKRNEAFVRIWRGAVALAQRTLTDWADPDGEIGKDIFLSGNPKKVLQSGLL